MDESRDRAPQVPRTSRGPMVAAGILLLLPVVALVWVPSYNQVTPRLWGFPFFFWYQFLWVFLCAGATWSAYRLTLAARRPSRRSSQRPAQGQEGR